MAAGVGATIPLLSPILEEASGAASKDRIRKMIDDTEARYSPGSPQQTVMQLRDLMKQNEARLAAMDPQRYAELLTGRKLPRGAMVFGSPRNREGLDEVLLAMSRGAI